MSAAGSSGRVADDRPFPFRPAKGKTSVVELHCGLKFFLSGRE